MTLQLTYKSQHLSITAFNPVELPDFVVLTGVNGSGKSHLLEAIEKKCVSVSSMENENIVLFNYENFKLENEPVFNGQQLQSEKDAAWDYFEQHLKSPIYQSRNSHLGAEYEEIKSQSAKEGKPLWRRRLPSVTSFREQISNHFNNHKIKTNQHAQGIISLAKTIPYSIDEITQEEFRETFKPFSFKHDFLPNQLGKIFWDYYLKYKKNRYNAFENKEDNGNRPVLTDEKFIQTHGPKPWDLINQILQTFDTLTYKVNSPEGLDYFDSFQLKLQHTEKANLQVEFNSLSSGEKVLMALVASVYKSSSDGHFPDLLLLDEVDASLHPAMMKNMLSVIQDIFLSHDVKVILVTHSPTTIALAPEESLFLMNQSGENRIEKKSKQDALSVLTQGFATIEQGLKLFDQVTSSPITIITEGDNAHLIAKAFELYGVSGVEVLHGCESITGDKQLRTLYDFFSRTNHENDVIFVWDCDVTIGGLTSQNKTHPFKFAFNEKNSLTNKGIENLFEESLFDDFIHIATDSFGHVKRTFDNGRKRDFKNHVLNRNEQNDFSKFQPLFNFIEKVKEKRN